jgi:hypothetical protein
MEERLEDYADWVVEERDEDYAPDDMNERRLVIKDLKAALAQGPMFDRLPRAIQDRPEFSGHTGEVLAGPATVRSDWI